MRVNFKSTLFLLGTALIITSFSCKEETNSDKVKTVEVKFKKEGTLQIKKAETDSIVSTIDIEIADDDYQRATGLMYRKAMEDSQGMLFIFDTAQYQSFYMRNTQIPLDIIYLDSDKKVINIYKDAKPMDETSMPSSAPAKYVLEIKAGLSDTWHIEPGDYIEY